jgi:hypothetical protein
LVGETGGAARSVAGLALRFLVMEDGRRGPVHAPPGSACDGASELLERSGQLSALSDALDGVRSTSHGRLVGLRIRPLIVSDRMPVGLAGAADVW